MEESRSFLRQSVCPRCHDLLGIWRNKPYTGYANDLVNGHQNISYLCSIVPRPPFRDEVRGWGCRSSVSWVGFRRKVDFQITVPPLTGWSIRANSFPLWASVLYLQRWRFTHSLLHLLRYLSSHLLCCRDGMIRKHKHSPLQMTISISQYYYVD